MTGRCRCATGFVCAFHASEVRALAARIGEDHAIDAFVERHPCLALREDLRGVLASPDPDLGRLRALGEREASKYSGILHCVKDEPGSA